MNLGNGRRRKKNGVRRTGYEGREQELEYKERKGRNGEREWQGVNGKSLKKMASVIMSIIEGRSKFRKQEMESL